MTTEILPITEESLNKATSLLKSGEIIGMPTETVYGLAGDGTNPEAVVKIYSAKGRPSDNPLIAHVHKDFDLNKLVYVDYPYVYDLIKAYMPGPLTLVMRSKNVVCKEAVGGGDTLAVRMPLHKGCQELLKRVDIPVVAPSANISKHTSPVTAEHVKADLDGKIPLILDGGRCTGGIESTVLDVTERIPRILRAGLITEEMIAAVSGSCEIAKHLETDKVKSPGVKYTHYKPKCKTELFECDDLIGLVKRYVELKNSGETPFILCQDSVAKKLKGFSVLNLGKTGEEIASNLYDKLLFAEKVASVLLAVKMDRDDGVFLGIANRLNKSCG